MGITRAKKELTLTAARQRMVRGEIQDNQVSRFLREIPEEYLDVKNETPGQRAKEEWESRREKRREAVLEARRSLRSKPFETSPVTVSKADHLDYGVGDRVRHLRFGEGTVLEITEGRKDYEVRVEFDTAGVKQIFASFAKVKKI